MFSLSIKYSGDKNKLITTKKSDFIFTSKITPQISKNHNLKKVHLMFT